MLCGGWGWAYGVASAEAVIAPHAAVFPLARDRAPRRAGRPEMRAWQSGSCRAAGVTGQAGALLLATGFALGCAGIYDLPAWARAGLGILLRVALCLVPAVYVMVLSR